MKNGGCMGLAGILAVVALASMGCSETTSKPPTSKLLLADSFGEQAARDAGAVGPLSKPSAASVQQSDSEQQWWRPEWRK